MGQTCSRAKPASNRLFSESMREHQHAAIKITSFSCPHLYSAPGHKSLAVILNVNEERNTSLRLMKVSANRQHEDTSDMWRIKHDAVAAHVAQPTSVLKVVVS